MLNVAAPKTHPFLCKVRHHLTDNTFSAPLHFAERHSAEIGILGAEGKLGNPRFRLG
jgi:hypothetical protein